jgi:glutathione peroxidase
MKMRLLPFALALPVVLSAAASVYEYTLPSIEGKAAPLSAYKGKVLLLVNVASKCGFTPQYKGLEALYEKYKDNGLIVIGFPANNFMRQEPGTNDEIQQFCSRTYHVSFPMYAKVSVSTRRRAARSAGISPSSWSAATAR